MRFSNFDRKNHDSDTLLGIRKENIVKKPFSVNFGATPVFVPLLNRNCFCEVPEWICERSICKWALVAWYSIGHTLTIAKAGICVQRVVSQTLPHTPF